MQSRSCFFTSATAGRTTSTSFDEFPTTSTTRDTSTFVTFTTPGQSSEFGTVTDFASLLTSTGARTSTTDTQAVAGTEPAESDGATPTGLGSLGSGNGAAPALSWSVPTGVWVAALLSAMISLGEFVVLH